MLTEPKNTALGRRLSLTNRTSKTASQLDPSAASTSGSNSSPTQSTPNGKPAYRRSRSYNSEHGQSPASNPNRRSQSSTRSTPATSSRQAHSNQSTPTPSPGKRQHLRRSSSGERYSSHFNGRESQSPLAYQRGHPLAPIPGSPYATDTSPPPSPSGRKSTSARSRAGSRASAKEKEKDRKESSESSPRGKSEHGHSNGTAATTAASLNRTRSSQIGRAHV